VDSSTTRFVSRGSSSAGADLEVDRVWAELEAEEELALSVVALDGTDIPVATLRAASDRLPGAAWMMGLLGLGRRRRRIA
jgi:hypothetical protein